MLEFCYFKSAHQRLLDLRRPDAIYLHTGRLFSIHIFDHSAAFDCRDILDAEKGMLEVYQKRILLRSIRIYENFRKFSRTWFSKKMRIIGKIQITLNRCWNLRYFRDQVPKKSAPHNFHSKR